MPKRSKVVRGIAAGAAIAGAAGYVAGILTAPKSGKQTRKDIAKTAEGSLSDIEQQLKDLQTELGSLVEEAKGKGNSYSGKAQTEFNELVNKAKGSKDKMRSVISAMHDGDASDKDLKKAMKDAKHAIEHIRDFIQK
jgi:gas vesicle protein